MIDPLKNELSTTLKFNKIDYGKLKTGDNIIFQGSLEMPTIGASTTGETGPNTEFPYPTFTATMSLFTASWLSSGDEAFFTSSAVSGINTIGGFL